MVLERYCRDATEILPLALFFFICDVRRTEDQIKDLRFFFFFFGGGGLMRLTITMISLPTYVKKVPVLCSVCGSIPALYFMFYACFDGRQGRATNG